MILKRTISDLKTYATYFRLGQPLEVTDSLINLLTEITPQLVKKKPQTQTSIEEIISHIMFCQESEDWLGLADYLEFELSDFIRSIGSADQNNTR